jgi:hypothetical protein
MDAPRRCPRCSSDEVIRILYGTPSPDLLEEVRAGRVALGAGVKIELVLPHFHPLVVARGAMEN